LHARRLTSGHFASTSDLAGLAAERYTFRKQRGLGMHLHRSLGSLAILFAALSSSAMAAEECGPLKEITTLEATRLPESTVMT